MPKELELWIAWRHLRSRRGERFISLITWLSVAGVAVGVMSLIVVFAVMTGYKETLRDKIVGLNAHVTAFPVSLEPNYPEAEKKILGLPGVTSVSPFVLGQAMVTSPASSRGVLLRGLSPGDTALGASLEKMLGQGSLQAVFSGRPTLLLGKELAAELKVNTGDQVRLTVPVGGAPRLYPFLVGGIFSSGMFEFDSKMAVTSLGEAQTVMGTPGEVTGLEIRISDILSSEEYSAKIREVLGGSFSVADWKKLNHNMFYALELQRVVLSLIMGLVVLVAAFNVAATLIMVVLEKTREIGILKAMGARKSTIGRVFAFEGLVIGSAGAALGAGLGLTLCFLQKKYGLVTIPSDIYLFDTLPVSVDPAATFLFAAGAVVLCYLATAYPSWRASRQDPLEAIRKE